MIQKSVQYAICLLYTSKQGLVKRLYELEDFKEYGFTKKELKEAVQKAEEEYQRYKADIRQKGEETIKYIKENNLKGIVLSGRPYHIDPEINHGIDTMITSLGLCVLSEDSIAHLSTVERPIRVVDQWVFHSRLYSCLLYTSRCV